MSLMMFLKTTSFEVCIEGSIKVTEAESEKAFEMQRQLVSRDAQALLDQL